MQTCTICDSESHFLFQGKVLDKYNVSYYKCEYCGFIQTEAPYWLTKSYSQAITDLDIGYVMRNLMYRDIIPNFLMRGNQWNTNARFLDWGGGYGLFVRMMRDKGFDFYREDKYCNNLFARYFDLGDIVPENRCFEMLTCFEVFEHLVNPLSEIEEMLKYSNSILFSTELIPQKELTSVNDWWYFAPEHGQHIAFYTQKSLKLIAERYGLNFYTDNHSTHLFSDKILDSECLLSKINIFQRISNRIFGKEPRVSLLNKDVQYIHSLLNQKNNLE